MKIEYLRGGRQRSVSTRTGKFLITAKIAREVVPEPVKKKRKKKAPAEAVDNPDVMPEPEQTYSRRDLRAEE